jgi:hypothetical protein
MSSRLVQVYAIWSNVGGFVGSVNDGIQNVITVNCNELQAFSPRRAWLKRNLTGQSPTVQYILTFSEDDPGIDSNTIAGYAIEQNGQLVLVDITTDDQLINYCNGCCDGSFGMPVPSVYNGNLPAFAPPTLGYYCVTRADDGNNYAVDKFATDYSPYYTTMRIFSYLSGTSKYQIQSYDVPPAMGSDTIALGNCT